MQYDVEDFNYNLPNELIAQKPAKPRDHSRLLLLDKKNGSIAHKYFYDIANNLNKDDLLVLNNTQVFPARLIGQKEETGGQVEIFLHKKINDNIWECLIGGRVKCGIKIDFKKHPTCKLLAEILKDNKDGTWLVKFNESGNNFFNIINRIGEVPLPPYIKRNKSFKNDKNSYQTVFANNRKIGSAAAPTAGLHFTKKLLKEIEGRGVKIVYITLHVGLGTFAPVKTKKIVEHKMHSEYIEVNNKTIKEIINTKNAGGRVVAVGTTSARTLESISLDRQKQAFWTNIFIYPGYKFKIVDALITNFHLPKSTLLMLVSALAGKKYIDKAYAEAIRQKYRFFSYGDAMFIY